MKKYEDMEGDAYDAYNATATTREGDSSQPGQIAY